MPYPKEKNKLQAFLGIINYLGEFPHSTASICELLQKLTPTVWMWNALYQTLYDEVKL